MEQSLGEGECCCGAEDYLQFSRDFEGWMNLSYQGNVFHMKEVGYGIFLW